MSGRVNTKFIVLLSVVLLAVMGAVEARFQRLHVPR